MTQVKRLVARIVPNRYQKAMREKQNKMKQNEAN
jgi:hypothetical protein